MKTYSYKISKESLLSRIPALFAYIDYDNLGNFELHIATDSPDGCYGKIIEDITLPSSYTLTDDNGTVELEGGKVYSYRILIDYYYRFRDTLGNSNSFIQFIDDGIGKKDVKKGIEELNREECKFDNEKWDLVPDYIYLATARTKYEWFVKRKKLCDAYNAALQNDENFKDSDLCCACEEYERSGGDCMKDLLEKYVDEANQKARTYLGYASRGTSHLSLNIFLNATLNDMGMVSLYIDNWRAGEKYNIGDLVFYNNNTYVCIKETTGYWNEYEERLEFDTNAFRLIKETTDSTIPSDRQEKILYETSYPNQGFYGISFEGIPETYTLEGTTDGKLKTLRRYKDYTNSAGIVQKPSNGYDWLYYYRVGIICNYETSNDNLGNISHIGEDMENGDDLYAYGDVITNIEFYRNEDEEYIIRFEYVLGAHFKAEHVETRVDDDGNKLYYFDNMEYDDTDLYHGVRYVETYKVDDDSEIIEDFTNEDGTVNEDKFSEYVNGNDEYNNKQYEFNTSRSMESFDKTINDATTSVRSIISSFTANIENKVDYEYNRIFRNEYGLGITYAPDTNIDVFIERGNASAMERHIKLGEVSTLEDMQWYANGGFFNIVETTG